MSCAVSLRGRHHLLEEVEKRRSSGRPWERESWTPGLEADTCQWFTALPYTRLSASVTSLEKNKILLTTAAMGVWAIGQPLSKVYIYIKDYFIYINIYWYLWSDMQRGNVDPVCTNSPNSIWLQNHLLHCKTSAASNPMCLYIAS